MSFGERLLRWFDVHRRDLPWRDSDDPWSIWVSEVMLQQTRVEAVRQSFVRFMSNYPTPQAFANIDDDELLLAWKGLGYYRRARMLRDGAQVVCDKHGGQIPNDTTDLRALPGVGDYTTGAIASIAFGLPEIAVDGNVERVIARHLGITTDVKREPARSQIRTAVRTAMDEKRPGDFNQALMELGALLCTPRSPECPSCPIAVDCRARLEGKQTTIPVLPARRQPVEVESRVLLSQKGGRTLGLRLAKGEVNAGQIELPGPGVLVGCKSALALREAVRERFGIKAKIGPEAARIRHGITHHRITLIAHWGEVAGRVPRTLLRADPADPGVPWTTPMRKLFEKLGLGLSLP